MKAVVLVAVPCIIFFVFSPVCCDLLSCCDARSNSTIAYIVYPVFKKWISPAYRRVARKLDMIGMVENPYLLPKDSWVNDPTKWPDMSYGSRTFIYLINTPGKNHANFMVKF